jgi:TolB-like protein
MKKVFILLILSTSAFAQDITMAIMGFEATNIEDAEVRILTDRLTTKMAQAGKFVIIERARMNEVLAEQGFQQSGCVSSECAVEAGSMLGVDIIVTGSIGKLGDLYTLDVRAISVESGKIVNQASQDCECKISVVLREVIPYIANELNGKGGTAPTPIESTTAQIVSTTVDALTPSIGSINLTEILPADVMITLFSEFSKKTLTWDHKSNIWGQIPVGEYKLNAQKGGYISFNKNIEIKENKETKIAVAIKAIGTINDEINSIKKKQKWYLITSAVLALGSGYLNMSANSLYDDYLSAQSDPTSIYDDVVAKDNLYPISLGISAVPILVVIKNQLGIMKRKKLIGGNADD